MLKCIIKFVLIKDVETPRSRWTIVYICSTPFISNMLHVIDLNVGSRREVDSLENSIFLNSHSPIAENMPLASFGNLKYPSDTPPPLNTCNLAN